MTRKFLIILTSTLVFPLLALCASEDFTEVSGPSADILNRYTQITENPTDRLAGSMEMDIDASVPSLKEHGRLHVLKSISHVGLSTYRVLAFQGDNTVKNQVIARYLQAEQQGQGDRNLAISTRNYKFRFKGGQKVADGRSAYVFQLSPRKKRVGLFKGELWLDANTCLPVYEKGRLVKNPSIFFKKVDFERAFSIQNGVSVPQRMTSTIATRLVGKVELDVNYSNFSPEAENQVPEPAESASLLK